MRIINEPTAAALAYALDKKKNEKIAVFDLGGGTFDISILEVDEEGTFQVKSTNGDTHLGGDDFDQMLIDHICTEFRKEHGIDLTKDPMAMQRLKKDAEQAKKDLSQAATVDINLPFITADATGPKHIMMSLTRSKFEQLVEPLIDRCRKPVLAALKDAGLSPQQIDEVVLVGGMTRMPRVQQMVKDIFGKEGHKGVNPDEVVGIGAAIQGAQLLLGSQSSILLLDVTPLSLGIETLGGVMSVLIPRNTTIPTKKSEVYTTASDSQPSVMIEVFQGERPMARDNKKLGEFHLDGIPPAPRGVPQVEVAFDLDANGVLHVSAKDRSTNKENKIRIENSSGINSEEIERMKRDAEVHADEDKRKRELADARNEADSLTIRVERLMREHGDKLSESDKGPLNAAIEKVKSAMKGEDVSAIKTSISELEQAAHAMAKHFYGKEGDPGASGPGGGPGPSTGPSSGPSPGQPGGNSGRDDVIDAEFEVKK
jgi:molecular chaperone DnaK